MKHRYLRLGLILACAGSILPGCEWIDHNVRGGRAPIAEEEEEPRLSDSVPEVALDPDSKRPFFKSSRLSGAMSSEGRDIERSLGID